MITNELNLSMATPIIENTYAKEGDSGRVLKINLLDAEPEDGTLRILRPDGVEVTSEAESGGSGQGNIVTFEAYEEVALDKLEVDLEPVQDLNGYDAPWVGGAGKNKLPMTKATNTTQQVTYTNYNGNYLGIKGTASANAYYWFNNEGLILQDDTDYVLTTDGLQSGMIIQVCERATQGASLTYLVSAGNTDVNSSFHTGTSPYMRDVRIYVTSGTAITTEQIVKVMVRLASETDATWQPYSNICPIHPSNGKNLLDINGTWTSTTNATASASGNSITVTCSTSGTYRSVLYDIPVSSDMIGKKLAVSWKSVETSSTNDWRIILRARNSGGTQLAEIANTNTGTQVITSALPSSTDHVRVLLYATYSTSASQGATATYNNLQVEVGEAVTPYVPYQGINVVQDGFNLWNGELEQGSLNTATGAESSTTARCRNKGYIEIDSSTSYYFKGDYSTYLFFYDSYGAYLGYTSSRQENKIFNPTTLGYAKAKYMRFRYDNGGDVTDKEVCINISGDRNGECEPYINHTYPIPLGRDVYGGTLDVVSGVLTVDRAVVTYDGSSSSGWWSSSGAGYYQFMISLTDAKNSVNAITNEFEKIDISERGTKTGLVSYNDDTTFRFCINSSMAITTVNEFMTFLTSNNLQIVYELATPQEYDLTPQQIQTLVGTNNIWSSGEVDVQFTYDSVFAKLPSQATEVVGKCIGDVNFTDISTLPFTLTVKENQT